MSARLSLCFFSGNRADFGPLEPVIAQALTRDAFDVSLIIAKGHAPAAEHLGCPMHVLDIAEETTSDKEAVKTAAYVLQAMGEVLSENKPDWLIILGDRFEALAAAQAAVTMNIPIAHLCGGDLSYGAVDEYFRHAISKLSHLHFTTHAKAAARVISMGEQPNMVHDVGHSGIDNFLNAAVRDKAGLFNELGLAADKQTVLACFHPVTGAVDMGKSEFDALHAAINDYPDDVQFVITGANADPSGASINEQWQKLAKQKDNVTFTHTLGAQNFAAMLHHSDMFIGNSSAIIYEAPVLGLHAVNVGTRQDGRDMPESVHQIAAEKDAISERINTLLSQAAPKPDAMFGDGNAAKKICDIIEKTGKLTNAIKEFYA